MARPPSSDARATLLGAAGQVLAEEGVLALSVDEVVRRSGVAKTTLYRHFGGLDGLVFALVASRVEVAEAPNTGSLLGDLQAIQRSYVERFDDPLGRGLFVWMVTKAVQTPHGAALFRRARFQPTGPTVVALQRAIARGELAPTTNIELAMHLIQGPLISKRVIGDEQLTDAEFDELLAMTVAGLTGTRPRER